MLLLAAAAPRFLAVAVGGISLYLYTYAQINRSNVSVRPPFALIVLTLFLGLSAIIGLLSLSTQTHSKPLQRAEFVMANLVRCGLYIITTYTLTLSVLATPIKHLPTAFFLVVSLLASSSFLLDILSAFVKKSLRIPSFIFSILASCLILALIIRITLLRVNCHSNTTSTRCILLACFQLLALAICAMHLQYLEGAVDIANWFCLLTWNTGTLLVLFQMPSSDPASLPASPKLQELQVPRRIPHVSVSEDFQCRDPFAGPLGISTLYPLAQHSVSSFNLKRLSSNGTMSRPASPSLGRKRSSFQFFSRVSSRPTISGQSEATNAPSFHAAIDNELHEVDVETSAEDSTVRREKSSSTSWLLSQTAVAFLPSLPPPAHLPSHFTNRQLRDQIRATDPPLYSLPTRSELDMLADASLPVASNRRSMSIDRTPTQSLYLAHFSSSNPTSPESAVDNHLLKPGGFSTGLKSLGSLPSIPSFTDTQEQGQEQTSSAEFENDSSGETKVDNSIKLSPDEKEPHLQATAIEDSPPREAILQPGTEFLDKSSNGHEAQTIIKERARNIVPQNGH